MSFREQSLVACCKTENIVKNLLWTLPIPSDLVLGLGLLIRTSIKSMPIALKLNYFFS